jgi:hypothetical protein
MNGKGKGLSPSTKKSNINRYEKIPKIVWNTRFIDTNEALSLSSSVTVSMRAPLLIPFMAFPVSKSTNAINKKIKIISSGKSGLMKTIKKYPITNRGRERNNHILLLPLPSIGFVLSEKIPMIGSLIALIIANNNCTIPYNRAGNNRKSV